MSRTLLLIALSLAASPVRAELLWEIVHKGSNQNAGSVGPVFMEFTVRHLAVGSPEVGIGREYVESDEGLTFTLSSELLPSVAEVLTSQAAVYESNVSSVGGTGGGIVDELWGYPPPHAFSQFWAVPHTPRLGLGLQGYTITDLTQTIDLLEWTVDGNASLRTQQTIRIFGEPEEGFLMADFNRDSTIGAGDYVSWRNSAALPDALELWRANFGNAMPAASLAAPGGVPEPSAAVLVLLACLFHVRGWPRSALPYGRTQFVCRP